MSNQRFRDLLEATVNRGFRERLLAKTNLTREQIKFRLVQSFEKEKKTFRPVRVRYELSCPGLLQLVDSSKPGWDFQDNSLVIAARVMRACIDPCVDEIIKLAEAQIKAGALLRLRGKGAKSRK